MNTNDVLVGTPEANEGRSLSGMEIFEKKLAKGIAQKQQSIKLHYDPLLVYDGYGNVVRSKVKAVRVADRKIDVVKTYRKAGVNVDTQPHQAEWFGESQDPNIWEIGGMNVELKTFEERTAAEFVEKQGGLDDAINTLAPRAIKSGKAREMLDILLKWKRGCKPTVKTIVPDNKPVREELYTPSHYENVRKPEKGELSGKEKYDKIISTLDLSHKDILVDRDWNPIIPIEWKNGSAKVNGMTVITDTYYTRFMKNYIFNQETVEIKMSIMELDGQKILAKPDVNDFFKHKRQEKQQIEEKREAEIPKFWAKVKLNEEGRFDVTSSTVSKKIIVPRRCLRRLVGKRGVWHFKVLEEHENKIIAEPFECNEEKLNVFDAKVTWDTINDDIVIKSEDIEEEISVDYSEKWTFLDKFGIWKLQVVKRLPGKIIAKPLYCVKTEDNDPLTFEAKFYVKNNGRLGIYCEETKKYITVPSKYIGKIGENPGLWKLMILDENEKKIIARPVKLIRKVEPRSQRRPQQFSRRVNNAYKTVFSPQNPSGNGHQHNGDKAPFHNRPSMSRRQVENRLEQLLNTGRLTL